MGRSEICTLCGASDTHMVQSFQSQAIIQRWKEAFQIDVQSEFSGIAEFELRRCEQCSFLYFAPESLCGSADLYAALDRFDWYYMPQKWEHLQALPQIRGRKSVLEIGCGFGDFIELARKHEGVAIKGLEQNPRALQEAHRRGLDVDSSDLQQLVKDSPETFDGVCAFQVLEHVPRPGEFLQQCCKLLSRQGRLIVGVPNADSYIRLQDNPLDMPPHHMSRWPVETIKLLPKLFPIRLVRLAFEPLAEIHVSGYVEAHCDRIARTFLPFAKHPGVKSRLTRLLTRTGARRLLRGMTVLGVFEKV